MKMIVKQCAVLLLLAGCMQNDTAVSIPTVSRAPADPQTSNLSCSDLVVRNQNITERLAELEAAQKTQTRTNAVTDAVVGVGLTALLGAGARSGVSGLGAAAETVQGIETVRRAEQGQGQLSAVSDSLALVQRSSELQRAIIEKGCQ